VYIAQGCSLLGDHLVDPKVIALSDRPPAQFPRAELQPRDRIVRRKVMTGNAPVCGQTGAQLSPRAQAALAGIARLLGRQAAQQDLRCQEAGDAI
jgi:hypothetical protein